MPILLSFFLFLDVLPPLCLSLSPFLLSLSPLHATDVFLRRSNRQESTGNKKGPVFPRREEYKAPSLHTADAESQSICHQLALPHGPERFRATGDLFLFLKYVFLLVFSIGFRGIQNKHASKSGNSNIQNDSCTHVQADRKPQQEVIESARTFMFEHRGTLGNFDRFI